MSASDGNVKNGSLNERRESDWIFVILHLQLYFSFLICLYMIIYETSWTTIGFLLVIVSLGAIGMTAGAHRLWAHKSYEATTILRLFLMLCQTLVGIGPIYDWVKVHRLHHKYYRTNLDPFNPSKGFLYSHFVSNTLGYSQAQLEALNGIDMSDLDEDDVIIFQKKFYWPLFLFVGLLLPINAPVEYWGETLLLSFFILGWLRLGILLHISWLIYSASNVWGLKPGEKNPPESYWIFFINKSHWLSYHHVAPWDYQCGEFGRYGNDCTSKFIRVCAALELASNLKIVGGESVRKGLTLSLETNESLTECLLKTADYDTDIGPEHYLTPDKYY